MHRRALVAIGVVLAVILLAGGSCVSSYNTLVPLDQAVEAQWAQVENAYQRRLDLVPNLVETVKGAAQFERETFTAVAEARSRAAQAKTQAAQRAPDDPEAFRRHEQAQEAEADVNEIPDAIDRRPHE